VSKHSRKRARHRKKVRKPVLMALCQNCASAYPANAEALLSALAGAMNACQDAGMKVHLRHGVVMTKGGYVLPIKDKWAPRTSVFTEFSAVLLPTDDPDDD
jgi:hypothetical protein